MLDKYTINGTTYVKLDDLIKLLKGNGEPVEAVKGTRENRVCNGTCDKQTTNRCSEVMSKNGEKYVAFTYDQKRGFEYLSIAPCLDVVKKRKGYKCDLTTCVCEALMFDTPKDATDFIDRHSDELPDRCWCFAEMRAFAEGDIDRIKESYQRIAAIHEQARKAKPANPVGNDRKHKEQKPCCGNTRGQELSEIIDEINGMPDKGMTLSLLISLALSRGALRGIHLRKID